MFPAHCPPPVFVITSYVQPQPRLQTNRVARGKLPWEAISRGKAKRMSANPNLPLLQNRKNWSCCHSLGMETGEQRGVGDSCKIHILIEPAGAWGGPQPRGTDYAQTMMRSERVVSWALLPTPNEIARPNQGLGFYAAVSYVPTRIVLGASPCRSTVRVSWTLCSQK